MEPDDETPGICSPFPPDRPDGTARTVPAEWRTEGVVGLARGILEDQAFERLPILADALEEAGCTDAALLCHCREPMAHCPSCWAANLALDGVPEVEAEPSRVLPAPAARNRQPLPAVGRERPPDPPNWRQRVIAVTVLLVAVVILKARPTREQPARNALPFTDAPSSLPPSEPNSAAELLADSVRSQKIVPISSLVRPPKSSLYDGQRAAAEGELPKR